MSSNEEYLDNLLKSMGEKDVDFSGDEMGLSADIDAMYEELEQSGSLQEQNESEMEDMSEFLNAFDLPGSEDVADMPGLSEILEETEKVSEEALQTEELPMEEPQTEEPPMEEPQTEELLMEEPQTEELPMEEPQIEELPMEEPQTEELLMEEPQTEEPPMEEFRMEEFQTEGLQIEEFQSMGFSEEAESAPTVESTQEMSQEEIESMLAAFEAQEAAAADQVFKEESSMEAISTETMDTEEVMPEEDIFAGTDLPESVPTETPAMDKEEEDILALLDSIQDDDGVSEINDLLSMSDNNEAVDESIFKEEAEAAAAAAEIAALLGDEGSLNEEESGEKKNKKAKKEKVKKEKVNKEQEGEEKAHKEPGFFGKLFSKLTEEDEVEPISEENQNIMDELAAEDAAEAGKKKPIKKGLMPGKKDGEEEGSDKKGKKGSKKGGKKEKPKKEPKPKKEKPKKEPAVPEKPGKRISKASMIVVLLFAGTVFGIVFFASTFLSGILQKQRAKDAFANQDYMSCYEELYGLNLSEEEEQMFRHARTVLKVERRLNRYERYLADFEVVEALDTLMQALVDYDGLYAEAQSCGAESEVISYYNRIYSILERDYGLSREAAHAIASCDSKVDYTRYLTALAAGEQISAGGTGEGLALPETQMQDVLPEEEELLPPTFLD